VGKDRTGWAVASVLMYLGVSWDDIVEDYLDSNRLLGDAVEVLLARVADRGGDPDAIETMLVVREEYLETFRTTMLASYGSIEGYVEDGLGLGPEFGARLREALVEPA
jgi:protein-tyrosine phosphatase